MPNQRLLEGEVVENNGDDSEMNRLRELNRGLTRELHDALDENDRLRKRVAQADAPIARLREKLGPFYQLLQAIFGDIDELAPEVTTSAAQASAPRVDGRVAAVWESWKQKLGNGTAAARVIDALLVHGELTTPQLKVAGKMAGRTVGDAVYKLNQLGLISKNGGRFSLKQL
jgi:hypothetical protein